ncbi:hypothetical protein PPL_04846 [Heterostelium album PN500]|uniref:DDE Tnp4 domain-containing protein n=1 Tax=Heterostelium pallidum (strain ATCC 26659 / Pp 5 / PN500) TaxID=670386 RepID=D3B8Q3_HETP5|nr:hypothetical protein PPL_04846 [Heterostelium album PN500]EFA82421.1 hypothetical protein PPL_04846 [Heterostelium album PN500]|eukprot:XP_020434538.1 hypothetical protein PPL_04846 [Heterostelium album PN500]
MVDIDVFGDTFRQWICPVGAPRGDGINWKLNNQQQQQQSEQLEGYPAGPYPGSQADIEIARSEEGILSSDILQKNERFIGDKAYQGERESFKAMIKKPSGGTLTPLEREFNAFLSSKRIIIENVNNRNSKNIN